MATKNESMDDVLDNYGVAKKLYKIVNGTEAGKDEIKRLGQLADIANALDVRAQSEDIAELFNVETSALPTSRYQIGMGRFGAEYIGENHPSIEAPYNDANLGNALLALKFAKLSQTIPCVQPEMIKYAKKSSFFKPLEQVV